MMLPLLFCCGSKSEGCRDDWLDGVPSELLSLGKKDLVVVQLRKSDVDEAAAVMRDSFAGTASNDPEAAFNWAMGPEVEGRWDDPRRARFVEWYMRFMFFSVVDSSGLVLGARSTRPEDTGRLLAVTLVLSPRFAYLSDMKMTSMNFWRSLKQVGGQPPGDDTLAGSTRRMDAIGASMRRIHADQGAKTTRHFYVWIMATAPTAQGRGCCRALLGVVEWLAGREGVPAHLETLGDRNVAVYSHLGYAVKGTYELRAGNETCPELITAMEQLPSPASNNIK
mmetsp:Transcript_21553/g.38428  ORF Transcript_21553/g.38428 Transcript_21553/m.38428 type:complete len:280 (-) Transcript_21553:278-1117(-)|eukprot:CAMPEP_0177765462 /NCGR_PEP_ID=MMETSP0491_2-20121128/8006_1 /TAXON_ID=63592 /ORGANISM="Tetraselmis chuii, Strain PLY429" /LENGTH=279 /DNA_ID=CAMNT_0019281815 /DNA_START=168 /DNA_END=1007 /DNA_ORIENTATION=+